MYCCAEIYGSKSDSRKLWRTLSSIMGDVKTASNSMVTLPMSSQRSSPRRWTASASQHRQHHVPATEMQQLREWEPVTREDVAKLISEAPNNSRELDTAATWLIKQCNGLLAPFIALLFNTSFLLGAFQPSLNMRSSPLC